MEQHQRNPVIKNFSSSPVVWKLMMIVMVTFTWQTGSLVLGISVAVQ